MSTPFFKWLIVFALTCLFGIVCLIPITAILNSSSTPLSRCGFHIVRGELIEAKWNQKSQSIENVEYRYQIGNNTLSSRQLFCYDTVSQINDKQLRSISVGGGAIAVFVLSSNPNYSCLSLSESLVMKYFSEVLSDRCLHAQHRNKD
jgi:hypothetical protein